MMHSRTGRNGAMTRWLIPLLSIVLLWTSLGTAHAAPQEVEKLPFVNNFATARFKALVTISVDNQKASIYGNGELVPPERSRVWLTDGTEMFVEVIQIGKKLYTRTNTEDWKEGGTGTPIDQALPVSAQFNQIQAIASKIYFMGDTKVGNTAAKHYQVWITGEKLIDVSGMGDELTAEEMDFIKQLSYKFDFWVGTADQFLYQQNVELIFTPTDDTMPALSFAYLVTFYDINDPGIRVNPPR